MGTYRQVFAASKFSSVENANRKHKSEVSARIQNEIVYVCIFDGKYSLLGKLKTFVEEKKVDYSTYGANYNGYGYQDHYHEYYLTAKDGKAFMELLNGKKATTKKIKSNEEIRDEWARSLVKKSKNAVSFEEAKSIAEEKLKYKDEKIDAMWSRQDERYSVKREKLINKMQRENPLRRIIDYDHALAIIDASERHNKTSYDKFLQQAHELERCGEIERGTAKEWARQQIKQIVSK